jgi:bacterioferritin
MNQSFEFKCSPKVMESLNTLFKIEMAGIIRYMHYAFMIMGYNRIPIQKWFRDQAAESMSHANIIGEKITAYGGHPPVTLPVEEEFTHDVKSLLNATFDAEMGALEAYKKLVSLAESENDIALEELARDLVRQETEHIEEVQKMLRGK